MNRLLERIQPALQLLRRRPRIEAAGIAGDPAEGGSGRGQLWSSSQLAPHGAGAPSLPEMIPFISPGPVENDAAASSRGYSTAPRTAAASRRQHRGGGGSLDDGLAVVTDGRGGVKRDLSPARPGDNDIYLIQMRRF